MRAAVHVRYGPPDTIELTDVPPPVPADGDVLIRIQATTVNRTDCGVLRGKPFFIRFIYGLPRPKCPVLGNEFAGRVESVGANVSLFKPGDDVVGYNDRTFGGHAQYVTMRETGMIARLPAGLSYEEAAPMAEGAHYALAILRGTRVGPGSNVLIYGATGAIGSAAVQLARHLGASVTAVCSTARMPLVRSLGAERVIDYTTEIVTNAGDNFDVVIDAVGKSSFRACRKLLKSGGIYASTDLGYLWQNPPLIVWTKWFGDKKVVIPLATSRSEDLAFLANLAETGAFRPVIDRRYSLEQVAEAFKYVETGKKLGNVVIIVDHDDAPTR